MSRPPPPTSKAPVSRETVDVVRKKISAPSGPPPAGMSLNFSAPKSVPQYKRTSQREEDESFDQNDEDQGTQYQRYSENRASREGNGSRSGTRRNYEDSAAYHSSQRPFERRRDDEEEEERYYDEEEVNDQDENEEEYEEQEEEDHHNTRRKPQMYANDHQKADPKADSKYYSRGGDAGMPVAAKASSDNHHQHHHNHHHGSTLAPPTATAVAVPVGSSSKAVPAAAGGGKPTIYNFQRLLTSTYRELKAFVMNPAPPNVIVRCYIERNRSGSMMLAPLFSLCADLEDGTGRELMVCRKILTSRTAHYVFSLKSEDLYRKRDQRSKLFLGKLRAISNMEYVLYDNGICAAPDDPDSLLEALDDGEFPRNSARDNAVTRKMERDMKDAQQAKGVAAADDVSLYRRELAVIRFNSKKRPAPIGIRGMEVCVPLDQQSNNHGPDPGAESKSSGNTAPGNQRPSLTGSGGTGTVFNIVKPFERIRLAQKQNAMFAKKCLVLHERLSRYDPLSSCLVDFKGRAHMASVKNFQLVVSDPMANYPVNPSSAQEEMLKRDCDLEYSLQLGKTTEECFNMDFKAPLSLLQCFAICIARFDAHVQW